MCVSIIPTDIGNRLSPKKALNKWLKSSKVRIGVQIAQGYVQEMRRVSDYWIGHQQKKKLNK